MISYVQEPGEPQYSATIRRWNLESPVPEGLFSFEAPEGAQKIDATAMTRPGDGDQPRTQPSPETGVR